MNELIEKSLDVACRRGKVGVTAVTVTISVEARARVGVFPCWFLIDAPSSLVTIKSTSALSLDLSTHDLCNSFDHDSIVLPSKCRLEAAPTLPRRRHRRRRTGADLRPTRTTTRQTMTKVYYRYAIPTPCLLSTSNSCQPVATTRSFRPHRPCHRQPFHRASRRRGPSLPECPRRHPPRVTATLDTTFRL